MRMFLAVVMSAVILAAESYVCFAVDAAAAALIDYDSGRTLFGQNMHERLPMASTTKIMTALLTLAYDYPTFLLAALGVGIAGGSFSVGVAYVAKWFEKEKQGTALGIFGAGNVGAAVTKFAAPVIMISYGW